MRELQTTINGCTVNGEILLSKTLEENYKSFSTKDKHLFSSNTYQHKHSTHCTVIVSILCGLETAKVQASKTLPVYVCDSNLTL